MFQKCEYVSLEKKHTIPKKAQHNDISIKFVCESMVKQLKSKIKPRRTKIKKEKHKNMSLHQ